jgi:tetratricopeptide (TPR) repeat protein
LVARMAPGRDHLPEQTGDTKAAEAETILSQAAACTKRGETGQAERLIRTLLAREPQHAGALYELGRISYRAGNKTAAADCLRKAIASQPDNGQFYNELAFVLIGLGDRQQAYRTFIRALEINPTTPIRLATSALFTSPKAISSRRWRRSSGRWRSTLFS